MLSKGADGDFQEQGCRSRSPSCSRDRGGLAVMEGGISALVNEERKNGRVVKGFGISKVVR